VIKKLKANSYRLKAFVDKRLIIELRLVVLPQKQMVNHGNHASTSSEAEKPGFGVQKKRSQYALEPLCII
jgi:hypothetical protein